MRLRQQAIVAETIELKRRLWHLSAIGSSFELSVILLLCIDLINAERMISYNMTFFGSLIARELIDSLYLIVFCLVMGFVVLVANKFFTAKVEQFQLEMDRLSLAFIERLTSRSSAVVAPMESYRTGFIPAKKTAELLGAGNCRLSLNQNAEP
jgi:hypothetical protein